jgi:5,10-methylenetetrahydromethanopterin reductase
MAQVEASPQLKLGVWFPGGQSPQEMARLAAAAEVAGLDSVWVAETPLARDAFVCLAAIAGATAKVELGTAIANPYIRHPAQLASAFATLDELSEGRAVCGVGIGVRDQLALLGYDVARPLRAARESVEMLRALLARETVETVGEKFTIESGRLGFRPVRPAIPIYMAATGPKMCALAGEIADGIYLPCGTPELISRAIGDAREGLPDGKPFEVAWQALVGVDPEVEVAKRQVRPGIGFILTEPNGESILKESGIDPDRAGAIRAALAEGGVRAMCEQVDDEILDRLTVYGDAEECARQLAGFAGLGVTHITASVVGADPSGVFAALAALRERTAA